MRHTIATALALPLLLAACGPAASPPSSEGTAQSAATEPPAGLAARSPIVIAHRGASGELPEHTIAAYERAIDEGADCIEPDLVMTRDGVLIARHDIYLSTTTDVAGRPEFASRKRAAPDEDHAGREDWWAADFTLAELKTLKARQPFEGRSKAFDGLYEIPTFDEVLALALARSTPERAICVYPEAKAPGYHESAGHEMSGPILAALDRAGLNRADAPVFIQSFETPFTRLMNSLTDAPVVMLAGTQEALDDAMSRDGAPFWDGIGVTHAMIINPDGSPTGLIAEAHARGEKVHTWTYRDDGPHRPGETSETEILAALKAGVDGFFTDFPATGVRVRDAFVESGGQGEGR
ncbi:glycerophosphodiester phosphodiesterase [bacterium]|nr:glycerophosphodiester phosphodiesterase [bacterium]